MNSADTADQMMKMTLEGIEVAAEIGLKAGGTAAKSLAVTLYAILTDNKTIKGKTNLDNMLKSGKELKVFAIHHSVMQSMVHETWTLEEFTKILFIWSCVEEDMRYMWENSIKRKWIL